MREEKRCRLVDRGLGTENTRLVVNIPRGNISWSPGDINNNIILYCVIYAYNDILVTEAYYYYIPNNMVIQNILGTLFWIIPLVRITL